MALANKSKENLETELVSEPVKVRSVRKNVVKKIRYKVSDLF